jgi:ion channel-forming bestrophin family protein
MIWVACGWILLSSPLVNSFLGASRHSSGSSVSLSGLKDHERSFYTTARRLSRLYTAATDLAPSSQSITSAALTTPSSASVDMYGRPLYVDSLERFAADLRTVLHEMRNSREDPTIKGIFSDKHYFSAYRPPSFTRIWSIKDWDRHLSRWRYLDNLIYFPTSRLLWRCLPAVLVVVVWSIVACRLMPLPSSAMSLDAVKTAAAAAAAAAPKTVGTSLIKRVVLPLTPLSLVSTFVAALISLRSNQGLSRLGEGRQAFGKVVLYTRDMAQLTAAAVYPKNQYLGLKLARHVSLFAWLLKNFLRGESVNGTDEDIIRVMLSPDPADAEYILSQRKKPVAVVTRIRQVISEGVHLNTAEEIAMDHTAHELNHCITTCERIVASPIPPLYTAHTGRLLMFYLFFLPLALRGSMLLPNAISTVLTTAAVAYAMIGLDEMSFLTEQPFRLMPLWHLSKNSMRDVGDALCCQPPRLSPEQKPAKPFDGVNGSVSGGDVLSPPLPYW